MIPVYYLLIIQMFDCKLVLAAGVRGKPSHEAAPLTERGLHSAQYQFGWRD